MIRGNDVSYFCEYTFAYMSKVVTLQINSKVLLFWFYDIKIQYNFTYNCFFFFYQNNINIIYQFKMIFVMCFAIVYIASSQCVSLTNFVILKQHYKLKLHNYHVKVKACFRCAIGTIHLEKLPT